LYASAHFADRSTGWAVGDGGVILHTEDAGKTWSTQASRTKEGLRSVHFADRSAGWAVGDRVILHTEDAGKTWAAQSSETGRRLNSVHFVDRSAGWAVGYGGVILHTEDAGKTWSTQASGTEWELRSVHFVDRRTGWAVGERVILHTEDAGKTWAAQSSGTARGLSSVHFVDRSAGWAVGYGVILHTEDAGKIWAAQASGTKVGLNSVRFVDRSAGWAVGGDGVILHTEDEGEHWAAQASGTKMGLNSVHFADRSAGWAVGYGVILHTEDAGKTWAAQSSGTGRGLSSVHFVDRSAGWAVGDDGVILHTEDAGKTWSTQASGTKVGLNSVHFVDRSTGWAAGRQGVILHTEDAGKTWSMQASGTSANFNSVHFVDRNAGWAVGDRVILHTEDEGEHWAAQASGVEGIRDLTSVYFVDRSVGWAVGDDGIVKAVRNNDASYVSRFRVTEGGQVLTLDWDIQDEHPEGVTCSIAYRSFENAVWQPIATDRLAHHANWFELSWDPAGKVLEGADLAYLLTLKDEAGILYRQEIPGRFRYRPWWSRQPEGVKGTLIVLGVLVAYYTLCGIVLWSSPLSLLWLHRHLPASELAESAAPNEPWKLVIRAALGLTGLPAMAKSARVRRAWLARYRAGRWDLDDLEPSIRAAYIQQSDCLDAWVERRAVAAREAFERIDSVARRRIHIPLPVRVGSPADGQRIAEVKPEEFRGFFRPDRVVLAIIGTGGGGKSSLAFQLARWTLEDDPDRRPAGHRMIPVLIEQETSDLVEAVGRNLRRMIGEEEVEADLVLSLVRHRRLLVIVDALSERSEATRRHVEAIHGQAPVNALVVTSRREPDFGPIGATPLWPERIDVNSLVWFLTEYLRRTGAEALFSGRGALHLSDRLLALVERGGRRLVVTPLLIRLFVDNAIELRGQGRPIEDLPLSVAGTMLEYLRRVNPKGPETPNGVPDDVLIRATRVLASQSLAPNYVPQDFDHLSACKALAVAVIELEGSVVVTRLIANGVLESRDVGGTPFLRFALDPVAEYLASLYWLDRLRGSMADWEDWLAVVRAVDGYPESIRGFLVALEDCTTAYGTAFRIPEGLATPWEDLEPPSAAKLPLEMGV
jgi:photosystem II stability/assembly factor-like uncharacterized protein